MDFPIQRVFDYLFGGERDLDQSLASGHVDTKSAIGLAFSRHMKKDPRLAKKLQGVRSNIKFMRCGWRLPR